MNSLDSLNAGPRDTATLLIDIQPSASRRICIELQSDERLVVCVMSTVPIDMFLCTDAEFHVWARGVAPSRVLEERDGTTSARFTFQARKTNHLSIVMVNESASDAQVGIDAVIVPASKPVVSECTKTRSSFLQVC